MIKLNTIYALSKVRSDKMKRDTMVGLITGSLIGATVSAYAISQMNPREQKRMLKRSRKIMKVASHLIGGMNML